MRQNAKYRQQRSDPANVNNHHENLVESKPKEYSFAGYNGRVVQLVRQGQMDPTAVKNRWPFVQVI